MHSILEWASERSGVHLCGFLRVTVFIVPKCAKISQWGEREAAELLKN